MKVNKLPMRIGKKDLGGKKLLPISFIYLHLCFKMVYKGEENMKIVSYGNKDNEKILLLHPMFTNASFFDYQ